jgi:hypothetical protein
LTYGDLWNNSYLVNVALMKLFGPSYLTAKLAGVSALLVSVGLSWYWLNRLTDRTSAICLVGLEVWLLLHWQQSFMSRPDSLLLLAIMVSMHAVTTCQRKLPLILGIAVPIITFTLGIASYCQRYLFLIIGYGLGHL